MISIILTGGSYLGIKSVIDDWVQEFAQQRNLQGFQTKRLLPERLGAKFIFSGLGRYYLGHKLYHSSKKY